MFWNARGAGNFSFRNSVADLIKIHNIEMVAICEPKTQFDKAKSFFEKLGFTNFCISEAVGFSGGIWLLWKNNNFTVYNIAVDTQLIVSKICINGAQPWILNIIYGSPNPVTRKSLWDSIDSHNRNSNIPFVFMGDFNELISYEDISTGNLNRHGTGMLGWVNSNNLIDMGFSGTRYTWTNNRISERLDRGFCCINWRSIFPEAYIKHLPKTRSDHCPILMMLDSNFKRNSQSKPFKFQSMWTHHENYHDFILKHWDSYEGNLMNKTNMLAKDLSNWNRDVFGHIFQKKKNILARIGGIQKSLDRFRNPFLINLEAKLTSDYNTICDQENELWKQKSRNNWLIDGDKNTKFFHISTLVRRRRNKIEGLFSDQNIWQDDPSVMKNIARNFFIDLFTMTSHTNNSETIANLFPEFETHWYNQMSNEIDETEIKQALFAIGKLKAPGHDGFPALFFQQNWDMCGSDIVATVKNVFRTGSIPQGLNHTIIALIPKIEGPQRMTNFRPISLCTTTYKIISKLIVARIRPVMEFLISPNQVSYVPGRSISDNIMVAQELLFKFKKSSGKLGFFAWKVDLAKAYDRVSWNFIDSVLKEAKFPPSLIKLIMHCISSVSFQISVNGELTENFNSQRGIRQGDPLSPYIFVLCMEKLSHLILSRVRDRTWKGVKASKNSPHVSHLFFADDLMLFAEATDQHATIVKSCLDHLCGLSGQSVSYDKSSIFCSPNTTEVQKNSIKAICGSPVTNNLGNYLGMSLIHKRIDKNTYQIIVDKVQSRLAAWKSNTLSMAARLVLINSVTSAIPNYAMQTTKLPTSLCDNLDQINRNFMWGESCNRKKIHLVNWNSVCKPKFLGGLGIKKAFHMNQAMLAKTSWRLWQNSSGLWKDIYNAKYLKNQSIVDDNLKLSKSNSYTWSSILFGADLFKKNIAWHIGNGNHIKFWDDHWIFPYPLIKHILPNYAATPNSILSDFWNIDGWNLVMLQNCLPVNIIMQIIKWHNGVASNVDDYKYWTASSSGRFNVCDAYRSMFNNRHQPDTFWEKFWQLHVPPKHKTFLWTMVQGKLLTNVQRKHMHLTDCSSCSACPNYDETLLHLFRDCKHARKIWNAFPLPLGAGNFFNHSWNDWIHIQLMCKTIVMKNIKWCHLFIYICWFVWKWRNKRIFDAGFFFPCWPRNFIINAAVEWNNSADSTRFKQDLQVFWKKPPDQFFKLNTDGALLNTSGVMNDGGIIRDSKGSWVSGFNINLGPGSVLEAELRGIYHGVLLAKSLNIKKIMIESDSMCAINLLNSSSPNHQFRNIIKACISLCADFEDHSFIHIFREGNMLADLLAKSSNAFVNRAHIFVSPPVESLALFSEDQIGVPRSRNSDGS